MAAELDRIIKRYGNEAVFRIYGTGNLGGVVSSRDQIDRLMHLLGGRLDLHNSYSTAQISHAMRYTYGEKETGNHISDLVNSRLAVFFGNNPAETRMSGGGTIRDLVVAKQKNDVRIIVIDPRHTDTAAGFADEWIPIRPGTDAALVGGLAHVLIREGLVDQDFLDSHCLGYDRRSMPAGVPSGNSYKEHILGKGPDGTPKTPVWAAGITGIPAEPNRLTSPRAGVPSAMRAGSKAPGPSACSPFSPETSASKGATAGTGRGPSASTFRGYRWGITRSRPLSPASCGQRPLPIHTT
jgi:Tat-targeted selenate reductase subunit YnfE